MITCSNYNDLSKYSTQELETCSCLNLTNGPDDVGFILLARELCPNAEILMPLTNRGVELLDQMEIDGEAQKSQALWTQTPLSDFAVSTPSYPASPADNSSMAPFSNPSPLAWGDPLNSTPLPSFTYSNPTLEPTFALQSPPSDNWSTAPFGLLSDSSNSSPSTPPNEGWADAFVQYTSPQSPETQDMELDSNFTLDFPLKWWERKIEYALNN